MKRQTAVLIWASAILLLVVTCCIVFFVSSMGGSTKSGTYQAFVCPSGKIEGYSVYYKSGVYTIEKEDGIWKLEGDRKADLDQSAIEKMIGASSNISAIGTLSRKDLEKFDLSDVMTVSLDIDGADDVDIRFLGTLDSQCAFRVSGDRTTYVMYQTSRDILTQTLDSLRVTSVFPQLADADTMPDYYQYIDYDGAVTEVRLKTSSELATGKNNKYMMERPYRREVDDDLFEQQIAVKIPAIKAKSFVNTPDDDKSVYGLDKASRAELSFTWDKQRETLYLGKSENGAVFAMKEGKPEVFLINSSLIEFLQIEPFFVLDSGILKNAAEKVTGVKVEQGDMVYDITSSKINDETRQYFLNGKAASSYVFNEILESLGDISFKNEIDKAPQNTGDILITVYYENEGSQSISLVKTNEKSYAVFLNGKAEFEIYSEDVDELMEELKEAINNPARMD
ncbi:MAG: DUF4340 domain-containing protein [Clostridia bacterium]|nr:DUF4340 domain-containing protein [Clostridia bacterium]